MKLYYMKGSCALVPHIALEMIRTQETLDYQLMAMGREAIKSPEFLKLNPQGAVPLLQDGDFVLSQNIAIIQYLQDLFPKALLFGTGDLKAKAKVRQWLAFVNSDVHKVYGGLFNPAGFADDEQAQEQVKRSSVKKLLALYQIAESALEKSDYLTETFTIADAYLYVTLRWAKLLGIDLSALPRLSAFYERVEQQPAVQSALQQEGLK